MTAKKLKLLPQLFTFIFLLLLHTAIAQKITVTGHISSATAKVPVAGASVLERGTSNGVTTNGEGNFSISVPQNATLLITSIGFEAGEVAVNGRSEINIELQPADSTLDQVVVVGYGVVRKRDLTGAVSQVKAKDLNVFATNTPLQALQGRAAGVQVIQNSGSPGGSISVRIRGTNSVQGSNEPLYVVDGFPLNGSLSLLNNADIESMEILKDASAIAIYGSRGANGVVLITTKKGKAGGVQVDYESGYTTQRPTNKLKLMNPRQYAEFNNEQAKNDNVAPYFTQAQVDSFGSVQGTDWQDLVLRNAPQYNNVLTVSGGAAKTRFSVSGGIFNQDGIIRNSDYNRYSLRANVDQDLGSKFTINYSTNLTRIESQRQNSGQNSRGSSLISAMITAPQTLGPYINGVYRSLNTSYPFISITMANPVAVINENMDKIRSNKILGNVSVTYKPLPGLSIKVSGGIENEDNMSTFYSNGITTTNGTTSFTSKGNGNINVSNVTSLLNENIVNYIKLFGDHSLSATAGFTYQSYKFSNVFAEGSGFISNVQGPYDLGAASTPGVPGSSYSDWLLLSGLGRINYSFKEKYLATVSFRADGSSRYSDENKWGYFPAVALAWRISNEKFFKDQDFLSDLKLRASWGRTGSTAISPYQTLNQLNTNQTIFGNALFVTYAPGSRLPSPLQWETTEQTDIGVDFAFLKNKLRGSVDYYVKNTSDLLNTVSLPSSLGYTTTIRNIGEIQNKGVEFTVDADLIRSQDFRWDVSANFAANRNKVVKLYNGEDVLGEGINIAVVNDYINRLREGEAVGKFYGFMEEGYDATGKIKYVDRDRNSVINALDKTFIGDPNPDFIFGFNTNLSYKAFELSMFIQGSQGNDLFNLSLVQNLDYGFGLNMPVDVYENHWTPTNTMAKYPKISRTSSTQISDRFVEDGSYIRLKNIQLAYNIPVQNSIKWFRSAQLYVSAQNLVTITAYSGYDPEINSYGGSNSIRQGIDHYSYPSSKAITFGIRCGF
jgi:TonB-linked SusC/RagA family outer membrane protein